MCACSPARERKARDGRLPVAEDPFGGGRIQPFGNGREHHGDLVGRSFQTVQGGVATGGEGGAASRTSKRLDALGFAMRAIPDERMDVSIGDPAVRALLMGAGEALGVHSLGGSPAAFPLIPGARLPQGQVSRLRSRGDRWDNQAGCVA